MARTSYVTISGSKIAFGYPQNELCQNLNADMVDNYHASLIPAPNIIPVTNDEGKIPNEFLSSIGGAFERIDLTNANEDYELQRGQEAVIDFANATEVPLHIATYDDTFYEMDLLPSNPGGTSGAVDSLTFLLPNNTTYNKAFTCVAIWRDVSAGGSGALTYSSFRIGCNFACSRCYILNRTVYKNIRGIVDRYGKSIYYPSLSVFSTDWRDTTTPWTSLGTIIFPQQSSGRILVRRLN